ncbi:MAG: hypothetical protein ABFC56_07430, partial [Clostridiaceae bacterium]
SALWKRCAKSLFHDAQVLENLMDQSDKLVEEERKKNVLLRVELAELRSENFALSGKMNAMEIALTEENAALRCCGNCAEWNKHDWCKIAKSFKDRNNECKLWRHFKRTSAAVKYWPTA